MTVERVEDATAAAKESVVGSLLLAFSNDPVMRWMYPEAEVYLREFPPFCRAFGGRAFECRGAWATRDAGGAALWLTPGTAPDGDAIERHLMGTVAKDKLAQMEELLGKMDEFHPHEPHWYLAIIGVDGAYQGRGLGAKLLQAALSECDEAHLPGYLESSNPANIPLYERHGFEVVGEIREGDAPVVTPMYRKAR